MRSGMGDDLDVDAMLEAPYQKEDSSQNTQDYNGDTNGRDRDREKDDKDRKHDKSRDRKRRSRSKDKRRSSRDRRRSRSKDRRKSRSKDRRRSKSRDRKRRSSRDRKRSKSRSRDRRRSRRSRSRSRRKSGSRSRRRSRSRSRRKSGSRSRRRRSRERHNHRSKTKTPKRELTLEERDARTVFCMQLSSRIRTEDLEDFFSVVGKITDVRIITDAKTRRSKGIAYVEFEDVESVPLTIVIEDDPIYVVYCAHFGGNQKSLPILVPKALGLSGQKLLGIPIVVQPTLAEKNRLAAAGDVLMMRGSGPMRLYVGSLHYNITEEMIRSIFEPFGRIDTIQLITDPESGRSKGYGFVTFQNCDEAKKALEQLNGFELAGRAMKVNQVSDSSSEDYFNNMAAVELDDRFPTRLSGATGRLQLMAKLADGAGMELPPAAANALNAPLANPSPVTPLIATQCFLLSNMFDPATETKQNWAKEIQDDVTEQCNKHGGALHIFIDQQSGQGNVYVKCPSILSAVGCVNSLHGRFFAGKMITAAYVPVASYHSLFPDAMSSNKLL